MKRFEYKAYAVVYADRREDADATVNGWMELTFDGGYMSLEDGEPTVEEDDD